jgi:hypothetical protein
MISINNLSVGPFIYIIALGIQHEISVALDFYTVNFKKFLSYSLIKVTGKV